MNREKWASLPSFYTPLPRLTKCVSARVSALPSVLSKGVVNPLPAHCASQIRHIEWQEVERVEMVKNCCAVGCTNRWMRGCGVSFYRFPADLERRARWVAAVNRKNWQPTDHSWLCSCHFISGAKSDDPMSPDSVPSVFPHTASPQKRKRVNTMKSYERRKNENVYVQLEGKQP